MFEIYPGTLPAFLAFYLMAGFIVTLFDTFFFDVDRWINDHPVTFFFFWIILHPIAMIIFMIRYTRKTRADD